MKLLGRAVNDVLSEFYGPRINFNYRGSAAANVDVRVVGTGGVKVQVNTTMKFGSDTHGGSNLTYIPDPAGWTDVGGEITMASGLVHRAITPTDLIQWLRVIVTTASTDLTSEVHFGGQWSKG